MVFPAARRVTLHIFRLNDAISKCLLYTNFLCDAKITQKESKFWKNIEVVLIYWKE